MRLVSAMFARLAAQAMLASAIPAGVLIWHVSSGYDALLAARDAERLAALAAILADDGQPASTAALDRAEARAANGLAGRVGLFSPGGAQIAGPPADGGAAPAGREIRLANGPVIARIVRAPAPDGADRRYLGGQFLGIAATMGALLASLLVAAAVTARRWARPQLALYAISRAVAQGHYAVDIEPSGPVETAATMRNLGRVARSFDRLETARRTWMVSVAEELRKPAAALARQLDMVRGMVDAPARLEPLEDEVVRLARLAEDLHAVALADLGRLPVTFTPSDPRALIHNAIHANRRRAQAAGVTLDIGDLPQATVIVQWDGARIEQMFTALIENSLRYTPRGGRIELGLEGRRAAWRLVVDDNAPGIDVGLAQKLFEPFYRTTTLPGESVTGSGLGLATAQAIVEAHHGRIEASNSPLGGMRVTVILPATPPVA